MKNNLILSFGLLSTVCFAQTPVLHVPNNEQVSVLANETFALEGLVLDNSQNMAINNTTLTYTNTPAVFTTGEGVKRVYEWSNAIYYSGQILFQYQNIDLNGLNPIDLKIATALNGQDYVILPSTSTTGLSYVALNAAVNNQILQKLTLVTEQLLNIKDFDVLRNLTIYPNPNTGDVFYLTSNNNFSALPKLQLYDLLGKQISVKIEKESDGKYICYPQKILEDGNYNLIIQSESLTTAKRLIIKN